MIKTSKNLSRLEHLVQNIEQEGLCLKSEKWVPTENMLKLLIDNAENLGIRINKSYSSITPEDISPIFEKMNTWMEEIIKLKQDNVLLSQENDRLKKDTKNKIATCNIEIIGATK